MTTPAEIFTRARTALRPPPQLVLSEWIERTIRLPAGGAAEPGRMRLWAYQRAIADAITDPLIERVSVLKATRIGYTALINAAIASFVANDPASILLLEPTEGDCRNAVVDDIEPLFDATPALRGLLTVDTSGEGRSTLMFRRFAGGTLRVIPSRAPRNLRRHTCRVLIADEVDAMEVTAEGNPLRLAENRTMTFANRKIIAGSTPVLADTSHILRAYAQSDMRVYECPCPACGAFTEILWQHIEWQPNTPDTAAYRCPHCAALVPERHKRQMVAAGRWRITNPIATGHAGFRINALVSPHANAAWGKLAAEFLAAKEDPGELQTFVNTILAQGWNEAADIVDEGALAARAEQFSLNNIPQEVLCITAGADVQDDRVEVTFTGWTRDNVCLVLGHVVIWGSPEDHTLWAELDAALQTRWTHPLGGRLRVDGCVIDSGAWTDQVYAFAFPRAVRRIMAGKGVPGTRPAIAVSQGKVKGGRLWLVGVDHLKATIISRLARGQTIRFSHTLEPSYYEQLASERRVVRYSRGQPVRQFVRKAHARAEALDALVYCFAARQAVSITFDAREQELRSPTPPAPKPTVIRSKWLDGL